MAERHLHEDEPAPVKTIPQGVQVGGNLPEPYEEKDINIAATIRWFGALAIVTFVSMGLMFGLFRILLANEQKNDPVVPALLNAQQPPPAPRILPNRKDNPMGPLLGNALATAPEAPPGEWNREAQELVNHGLLDARTQRPVIPDQAAAAVLGAAAAPVPARGVLPMTNERSMDPGLQQPVPSNASGGLAVENAIR